MGAPYPTNWSLLCARFARRYPIVIGVPADAVVDCVPRKFRDFAPQKSRGEYSFGVGEEAEYKRAYRMSRFAHTTRKSGFDCLRHYEIAAGGTAPFFPDLEDAPEGTMAHWPRDLVRGLWEMEGVDGAEGEIDWDVFDEAEYLCKVDELLEFTRARLTTEKVAE
jgi:hypothetical protein